MKQNCTTFFQPTFITKAVFMSVLAIFFVSSAFKGVITTYPVPKGETVYDGYQLQINGQPVEIYSCRVSAVPLNQWWPGYQRPLDQTELAGFAYWDMIGTVKINITINKPIDKVVVRPLSLGIKPEVEGNKISFTISSLVPVVVEVNGYHNALHLFPNPEQMDIPVAKSPVCCYQCNSCSPKLDSIPGSGSSHLHYFGPGVHDVGTLQLQSNDSVYIAGGAVVYGSIIAYNASNIHIWGRGVLDGSRIGRADNKGIGGFGSIHFRRCSNIKVEGIVLKDPNIWGVTIRDCGGVNFSNVKMVGFWRYNADGIDVWNSRDVLIENCFVRAFDDVFVVRATGPNNMNNIRFNNCVLWCDWGNSFVISARDHVPTIENVTFENINIIRATHCALRIGNYNGSDIHNIKYDNVSVEVDDWIARPRLQNSKDEKYTYDSKDKYYPALFYIVISPTSSPASSGIVDNILYKDIKVNGNTYVKSTFTGLDALHGVSNVVIKNLQFNGKMVEDIKQANIVIGPYVNKVQILK
jgi:hypothetical protein